MFDINFIATWTPPHEGSLLYISEISKAGGANFFL